MINPAHANNRFSHARGHRFDENLVCGRSGCGRTWEQQEEHETKCVGRSTMRFPDNKLASVVPEPGKALLMSIGLIGLAVRQRPTNS